MAVSKSLYSSLDTPCVLLDLDKLEANIREMSTLAAEAGLLLRPHIKVHQSADITRMQVEAGACGIEVGTIDQAEVFAEEGFDDIMVAHPFFGELKMTKLKKLLDRPDLKLALVVDMMEQAEAISEAGQAAGRKVPIAIKIETGGDRYGVLPGKPALQLANTVSSLPGIALIGIYTHEVYSGATLEGADKLTYEIAAAMTETTRMMKEAGLTIDHVSIGSSSTYRPACNLIKQGKFPEINELHPGSCVIGSVLHIRRFASTEEQCVLTVLSSVMSTSHSAHAVIDAGSKTLGSDPLFAFQDRPDFLWEGKPSYGRIRGRPDLWLGSVAAESARVFYTDPKKKLELGERMEIIPNNPFIVTNIHDEVYGVRNGRVEKVITMTGRGRGS
jgi:D-serine deaminase-like pyridoxal phosphate-dependent protein